MSKLLFQAFEHSSDLQNNEKQRIALGENIMRLLLKLETIQGLHPSFRETRKSLARKLTCFQQRLDSVMAKRSQQQTNEFIDKKPVEDISANLQNEEHVKDQPEEKVAVSCEDSSVGINDDMMGKDRIEFQSPLDLALNVAEEPTVAPNEHHLMRILQHLNSTRMVEQKREPDHEEEEVEPIMELPIGLLDEEETIESKSVKRDEDMERMMERLMGLLDEEGTIVFEAMWCCYKRHSTGAQTADGRGSIF
ncbi:BAG family molecular chaperone regulator 6-like [Arachis ipaensis]|uniref:BAG family molecular chaperone regulator 6-like n=1 Tax=Arachis ipaensis TaxID=130454 RepID=UPI000A2AFEA5|nr:BAG family molecular chaperone regulator 6-like [Arachis ipaensis]